MQSSFEHLTPDFVLTTVEEATGLRLTGLTAPLPSYINRVYELASEDGTRIIAKFYRGGRWSREAILDEHRFVSDCAMAEVPVVAPLALQNGETLGERNGFLFALYPRRAGRQFEVTRDSDWTRLGTLVGRMHNAGATRPAANRITIDPRRLTQSHIEELCSAVIPEKFRSSFRGVGMHLVEMSAPLFNGLESIRIHGDCHRGNILDRLEQGLLLIDFDDMAMGPPVQDLWLLLPERANKAGREIDLFLQGYERFRRFDRRSLACIESLRAMRMIYFLLWCTRQVNDFQFRRNFPDWGSDSFWQREISDLREQIGYIEEAQERSRG